MPPAPEGPRLARIQAPVDPDAAAGGPAWYGRLIGFTERNARAVTIASVVLIALSAAVLIHHLLRSGQTRRAYEELGRAEDASLPAADRIARLSELRDRYRGTGAEPDILYRLANAYQAEERWDEAESVYDEIVTRHPDRLVAGPARDAKARCRRNADFQEKSLPAKLAELKAKGYSTKAPTPPPGAVEGAGASAAPASPTSEAAPASATAPTIAPASPTAPK